MRKKIHFVFLYVFVFLIGISQAQEKSPDFTVLEGPYFGQKPPEIKAEIFLDGFISTMQNPEMNSVFTKNGKEFYYCTHYKNNWSIFFTQEVNGNWEKPKPLHFSSSNFTDRDLTISPDEKRIYFGSNRPLKNSAVPQKLLNIFYIERLQNGDWSEPRNAGEIINGNNGGNYPSVANNGNLYFFTSQLNGIGKCDIFVAKFFEGRYTAPLCLSTAINSKQNDWDSYIAPDESYIIFSSQDRPDTFGDQDLYVSFRKENGEWTKARNMGANVNSISSEICPIVTLDGKYLFFTSRRRGNADIYWINSKIIEELKPEELK